MTDRSVFWRWLRPHVWRLALASVCILVVIAVELALPKLFGDYLVDGVLVDKRDLAMLTAIAWGGLGFMLIKGVFSYGQIYMMAYVGQQIICELRSAMYRRLLAMPLGHHMRHKSGTLVSRMTSDIGVIQNAVTVGLADMLTHSVMLVAIVAFLFALNWRLALLSLITLPLSATAIRSYGRRIRQHTTRLQARIGDLTATMQESLEGIRVVKAFRMEEERGARFDEDNRQGFWASMKSVQAMATVTPIVELILAGGMMVVVWYGGRSVVLGEMTPGGLMSFLVYLAMAARPVTFLSKTFSLVQQALSAAGRVTEVMNMPSEETDAPAGGVQVDRIVGRVAFEGVSFAYDPGTDVLKDIALVAEPGETVALVGPSGAGKTTLVNLIPRFYRPAAGRVTIDGRDVAEMDLETLRRNIGLVPQETLLFGMSVADNIAAGRRGIERKAIVEAAKLANAHDFIERLPDGYDTVIGERGATLSGGQRQRIAIARAVVGNPRILILDEATSALDAASEAAVRNALVRVKKDRTTFVIAHRLSTVMGASKIAVLDEGRIVELGTHEELLATGTLYPRLYETQFGADDASDHFEATVPGALEV